MILEYSVTNTFSIKDKQTISFEAVKKDETDNLHTKTIEGKKILKFACLYGANAAGKTNMIFALGFYLDFILTSFTDLKPDETTYFDPFRFDEKMIEQPGEFNLVFFAPNYNDNSKTVKYVYNLKLTSKKVISETLHYSPKGQLRLVFDRTENDEIKWGADITGAKKIISELTRSNCSLIGAGAQANHPVFSLLYSYFKQRLKGLYPNHSLDSFGALKTIEENGELKERIIGLLQSTDFGSITDIEIESRDIPEEFLNVVPDEVKEEFQKRGEKPKTRVAYLVHSYHGKDFRLPLQRESNGTQHVYELAQILDFATDSADVIVDEIDSSLHPDIVEAVLRLFLELSDDSQLIFTTHNQDLLESGILRDDEVWFCYKTDKGNSIYNSITDFIGIRKEPSRKKLYKAGKFGSLPIIDYSRLRELFGAAKD